MLSLETYTKVDPMKLATFTIPLFSKVQIEKRLQKLVKKALKYGNEDIVYSFGSVTTETVNTENGPRECECVEITVSGEAPQIGGYNLLARIELLEGGENLVHCVPGVDVSLDTSFRTHNGHCDHCNTDRRRNDVYVLTDGTQQIAVGRTCLRDFLGIDDPKSIVERAQFFEEIQNIRDEDFSNLFGSFGYVDLRSVLVIAAGLIRTVGYVSKAKQAETGDVATGESVLFVMDGVPGFDVETTNEDTTWTNKAIELFRSTDSFGNDYMDNLRVLFKQDFIKRGHVALVSSGVLAAQRRLAPKDKTHDVTSDFVGVVKERIRGMELVLEKIIFLGSGAYGPTYLHTMKDIQGNVFTWVTGNKMEADGGSVVKLDASIKEHKVYNGAKQTVLTRAKLV
jgi:hypothetical protein